MSWGCYPFSFLKQNVLLCSCLYYGHCKVFEHVSRTGIRSYLLLFYCVIVYRVLLWLVLVIGFNDCDLF